MTELLHSAIRTKFPLCCGADGKFRVLCVSDFHARTEKERWDPRLKLSLEALIRAHQPNLVFIAGDLCHEEEGLGSDERLREYIADVMELCEREGIAWAHVPGNHDREDGIPPYVFEEFPMCLSRRGPDNLSGYGTYAVPVWPHDGSTENGPVCVVWAFDSHTSVGRYAERIGLNPGELDLPTSASATTATIPSTSIRRRGTGKRRRNWNLYMEEKFPASCSCTRRSRNIFSFRRTRGRPA